MIRQITSIRRQSDAKDFLNKNETCRIPNDVLGAYLSSFSLSCCLLTKYVFSKLSTSNVQTSYSSAVMAKYKMKKLVATVGGEGDICENQRVVCILCGVEFQTSLPTSVQRHFEDQLTSSDPDPVEANMLRLNICDRDDYIKTCA